MTISREICQFCFPAPGFELHKCLMFQYHELFLQTFCKNVEFRKSCEFQELTQIMELLEVKWN